MNTYKLSVPNRPEIPNDHETLSAIRENAALALDVDLAEMVEVDADYDGHPATYCYRSVQEADADDDGAYAVKYWEI